MVLLISYLVGMIINMSYTTELYAPTVEAKEVEVVKEVCTTTDCLKELVLKEFPELYDIVSCESGFRHYDKNGDVLSSHTDDKGLFQINLRWWEGEAIRLGHDIMTVEGNLAMAKHIYKLQGKNAWVCHRILSGV